MATKEIMWTVLPNGTEEKMDIHIQKKKKKFLKFSVFVSPRLNKTDSNEEDKLKTFFPD